MKLPMVTLPPTVPLQRERAPQENIPAERETREAIKDRVRAFVEVEQPTTPLSFEELRGYAEKLCAEAALDTTFVDYIAVLINNEAWREDLARVPYNRRLLLLPKCLRVEDKCPAPFDEFGLLCKQCGLCTIQDLQEEAEKLGYACLVAEGSALVMALIQTGKVEAIVGVSCLSVLEKAFPYMEAAAIPGVAIPLLQDDCRDTTVDIEWVWDIIHLSSEDKTRRLDLDALRREVETWFAPAALDALLGPAESETEAIGRAWLARAGKRWRPFLAACAFKAMRPGEEIPADFKRIAVAVECFHKASLIHDDIEDEDELRYGESTLHVEHGTAVALNVGDFLLGEGYRLVAECEASPAAKARMLRDAARGHRSLCLGQGAELCWTQKPGPLASREVLEIFRQKTAPAFEVALQLGAGYAEAEDDVYEVLNTYSEALGIAYQIRDDLEDLEDSHARSDLAALRPSLPLAIAHERAGGPDKELTGRAWSRDASVEAEELAALIEKLKVEQRAKELLEAYKEQAVRSLMRLENSSLKGLLRRVLTKIFSLEIQGWCSEFEARNAPGRPPLTEAAR